MTRDKHHNKAHEEEDKPRMDEKDPGCPAQETLCPGEKEKLEVKAAECDELREKNLRLHADFDNARKRWERERSDIIKFATFSFIQELLVIVDEFEHALSAIPAEGDKQEIRAGIEMTYNKLVGLLKKEGLTAIEARGKKFDPHVHEIVGQRENDDVEEHVVLEEVQKGYRLNDRLLRTSKVIIATRKPEQPAEEEENIRKDAEGNSA